MKSWVRRNWPGAGRRLLGLLLLWAGIAKVANPTEFLGSVYAYQLPLPALLLKLAAACLPWAELLLGLLLLWGVWTRSALVGCLVLLSVFTLATAQAWWRGLSIACGCFDLELFGLTVDGAAWESVGVAFWRNLMLGGVVVGLLAKEARRQTASMQHRAPVEAASARQRRRGPRRSAPVVP